MNMPTRISVVCSGAQTFELSVPAFFIPVEFITEIELILSRIGRFFVKCPASGYFIVQR